MNDNIADTIEFRRKNKIRGLRGTNWRNFYDGVPPEDDDCDYEWNGSYWVIVDYPEKYY